MNAVGSSLLIGRGLYPLSEAARLVQIQPQTARRWALGNRYNYHGERRSSEGLIAMELPLLAGQRDVTFAELLTLRMVKSFRAAGLGIPTIRRVAARAAADYGRSTPLVSKRFRTDGRKVFIELRREAAANDEEALSRHDLRLIDILSGQEQFADVVEPSLFRNVEWEDDWHASRWWPAGQEAGVVLDPAVLFGTPRISGTSVPTAVLAQSVKAEGGGEAAISAVADWHGLNVTQVQQAVAYETEWLARAA